MNDRSYENEFLDYLSRLSSILGQIDTKEVSSFCNEFEQALTSGRKIFVIGNGGSAALASHFATDLGSGSVTRGKSLPVISLADNVASITAAANDFGFNSIFSRQLVALATKDDLLLIISSSGNSENLMEALEVSKKLELQPFALLGFDGGKLFNEVKNNVLVKSGIGDYGPVEDAHSAILHSIAFYLRRRIG
jgi:D-sedoheptulose 7-phosphate isomerase